VKTASRYFRMWILIIMIFSFNQSQICCVEGVLGRC
jgi:hypothetical protein